MHIDQLKEHFPDELACRRFFENWIWATGRRCPRCKSDRSYRLTGRVGLYEFSLDPQGRQRDENQKRKAQNKMDPSAFPETVCVPTVECIWTSIKKIKQWRPGRVRQAI